MSRIYYYHHTTSTNKIALSLGQSGAEEGVAVIAESQDAGRGRLGKTWQSPSGKGLYCSLIIRPRLAMEDYPKITLTVGLAVANVLEKVCGEKMYLKWPNDVYAAGKKCCGILTESSSLTEEENKRFAVVGIGINVNSILSDFPQELNDKVTSLKILTEKDYDVLDIFLQIRKTVMEMVRKLQQGQFPEILTLWRKRDMLVGKWTQWLTNSGKVIFGHCEGPDDSGQLLVKDEAGKIHQVLSGDINLARQVAGRERENTKQGLGF